jgi:transcriptional regulator with XRE-family HTH domain
MTLREIFASNLRNARHRLHLSQEALADAAGIDRTYVSALERSQYSASLDMISDIADALGVAPDELLKRSSAST